MLSQGSGSPLRSEKSSLPLEYSYRGEKRAGASEGEKKDERMSKRENMRSGAGSGARDGAVARTEKLEWG